jgi:alkylation response protein AidB-like acyl-CoA dehydrogenase
MLRDSVARFVQDDYDFDTRRAIVASDEGMSRENWQTFAELGWLSVPFAEEHGGFGGGPVDVMVMMEEFGKGLVVEPYLLPRWCCSAGCCAPRAVRAAAAAHIPGSSTAVRWAPLPTSSARAATSWRISPPGRRPTATATCSTARRSW